MTFNHLYHPLKEQRTGSAETDVASRGETVVDRAFPVATSALEGIGTQDGAPVPDLRMHIAIETASGVETSETRTDTDGHYLLEPLPPGLATITVRGPDTPGATELTIDLPPDNHLYQDIALESELN